MTTVYIVLGVVALGGILIWFAFRAAKGQGAAEQRADDSEKVNEHVKEAKDAKDAARRDSPDARRKRLRRYSRG